MYFRPQTSKIILFCIFIVTSFGVFSQSQDINLTENGNDIFNGGTNSPSLTNGTDFGDVEITSIFQTTFTIENTISGGSPKNNKLTVSNISISGANAADFVVSGISLPAEINRSGETTFIITFSATILGSETASVSIASDDPDENPYTFNISGTGVEVGLEPSLTLTNTYALSVLEPSGLAYDKINNELFTVSDNTNLIYKISTTGVIQQTLSYSGNDLEGVSMYSGNKILVAEEGNREIIEYDYAVDDGTFTTHAMNTNSPIDGGVANDGIEGVTYDGVNDKLYFLIEKNNGGLYVANGSFSITNEYEDPLAHGGDYSGSHYVEETGFLWLASDQTSTIYKCNTDGTVVQSFPITTAGGAPIDKLEGIAIDYVNQLLYAVSDLGQELYVFAINDPSIDPPTIVALEDTFPTLDGINGETTTSSVLDNDTLHDLPATLAEVSLSAISILDSLGSPTTDIVLNADGTVSVLANTATEDYSLTYEICELADPVNCSQVTNTISVLGPAPSTTDVIIAGDSWNYYDNENEPSGSWKTVGYDDSSWSAGNAILGFNNGETTTLNAATNTAYFRKTISITNAISITNIDLAAIRDDGMIVYVNGAEVWRDNMPTGTVDYSTVASSDIKDAAETTWINQSIANNLVEGNNAIAVEIHIIKPRGRVKTPDMSFDFTMTTTSSIAAKSIDKQDINSIKRVINNEITLYPLPANSQLNIAFLKESEKLIEVSIFDQNRRLLQTSENKEINVRNLKEGVYFVKVISTFSTYYKTIIIKN